MLGAGALLPRRWQALGITPDDIANPADYARLPMLTKADVREISTSCIARRWRGRLLYKTTGGSTGEPLRFGYTRESYERRISIMWRGLRLGRRAHGTAHAVPVGCAVGASARRSDKDRLYHAAFNRHMLNAFQMSERAWPSTPTEIDRFRPETIVSYVAPM